jgi:hypothetical protein
MLDIWSRTFLLHLLLNATFVVLGAAVGLVAAWRAGLERRFVVRRPFFRKLLLLAVAVAALVTLLSPDSGHPVLGLVIGLITGFGTAYLSRVQAKPNAGPGPGSSPP